MKVSVLIPVYNAEKFLRRCIDSVLSQTYQDIEIVCIDDGSSDASPMVLDDYAQNYPCRVKVEHRSNAGVANARNRALELATGDYVAFIDDDDFVDSDYIETLVHASKHGTADIVLSGYRRPDVKGKIRTRVVPVPGTDWAPYAVEAAWAKLYRLDFVRSNRLEFMSTNILEDLFFTIPSVSLAKEISVVRYCGYNWFFNSSSVSNTSQRTSKGLEFEKAIDSICERLKGIDADFSLPVCRYLFDRLVVWFLLYTAQGDGMETALDNMLHYREWLSCNLPAWEETGYRAFLGPKGDALKNRSAVWLFTRHPALFRRVLIAYSHS